MTNNMFWTKSKNQQQIKTANIKILAKAGNLGPLTPKSCALPLDHHDNLTYRLMSSYLIASTHLVEP